MAWPSITVVVPWAFRPASRIADFTCADATGSLYSIALALRVPLIASGRRPPSRPRNCAPICDRGSITRFIGRLISELSPVKIALSSCEAQMPSSRRVDVPLFPISRISEGSFRLPTPIPCTRHNPSLPSTMRAPNACMALAVFMTSSPSSRPEIIVSPSASAPNISERCDIDLSPGIFVVPFRAEHLREIRGVAVIMAFT